MVTHAYALIRDESTFFVVQVKHLLESVEFNGIYNLPGGKVEEFETIQDAVVRETQEETGYVVTLMSDQPLFHSEFTLQETHDYYVFDAKIVGGIFKIAEDEISDTAWVNISQFRSNWSTYPVPEKIVTVVDSFLNSII